jgi:hypothetical protein
MVPRAMSDLEEEADDEYMEVEPMADTGVAAIYARHSTTSPGREDAGSLVVSYGG